MTRQATFTRLEEGAREDFDVIQPPEIASASGLADHILDHLRLPDGDPGGDPVNRRTHHLQSATLAKRDGRDDDDVVCALLHDMGDVIGGDNHAETAAAVPSPFVNEENLRMAQNHGVLQAYSFFHDIGYDQTVRDILKSHRHRQHAYDFIELYDDPVMDVSPLTAFEPMVRALFERPVRTLYAAHADRAS